LPVPDDGVDGSRDQLGSARIVVVNRRLFRRSRDVSAEAEIGDAVQGQKVKPFFLARPDTPDAFFQKPARRPSPRTPATLLSHVNLPA
jgi:hypothetical protein